jgi:hypothetical protein
MLVTVAAKDVFDASPQLHHITAPTLLIAGEARCRPPGTGAVAVKGEAQRGMPSPGRGILGIGEEVERRLFTTGIPAVYSPPP